MSRERKTSVSHGESFSLLSTVASRLSTKLLALPSSRARDGNIVLAPYSILQALLAILCGAGGDTKRQLKAMLFGGKEEKELDLDKLFEQVRRVAHQTPVLQNANALWTSCELADEYVGRLRKQMRFEAHAMRKLDAEVINEWVTEKTGGLIHNMVDRLSPNDVVVLTNALCFRDDWAATFDPQKTQPSLFTLADGTACECQMMQAKLKRLPYIHNKDDGYRAIYLAYCTPGLGAVIVLPDLEREEHESKEQTPAQPPALDKVYARLVPLINDPSLAKEVTVYMPKLDLVELRRRCVSGRNARSNTRCPRV